MKLQNMSLTLHQERYIEIQLNMPDHPVNVLSWAALLELEKAIETCLEDKAIMGLIITSGRKDFLAGVDLQMIRTLKEDAKGVLPQADVFQKVMRLQSLLRRLETGKKPVVCIVKGICLGGGFELALSCHHRIAIEENKLQLGLPEVTLGLMPGAGGTQRLTRLLGVTIAAPFLLEGRNMDLKQARNLGILHQTASDDEKALEQALNWLVESEKSPTAYQQPWDQPRFKIPGDGPFHPAGFPLFVAGNAMTMAKTQGLYQAQQQILQAVYEGLQVDVDTALRLECRHFVHLLYHGQSDAMIRTLFYSKQELEAGVCFPAPASAVPLKKLAVLGGGMMGAAIAFSAMRAGIKTIIIEENEQACAKATEKLNEKAQFLLDRNKVTNEQYHDLKLQFTVSCDYADIKGCDLVIEAVPENLELKRQVLLKAEEFVNQRCIMATNTSSLMIDSIVSPLRYKRNFVGIHFFSPVEKMKLVEIVKGRKTGNLALAKAVNLVRKMRKIPIQVKDAFYFYANYCIIPYIGEAHHMLLEGVSPVLIENAALSLGMPVGPLQLNDEVSLTLAMNIYNSEQSSPEHPSRQVLERMLEKGRQGRYIGQGFYDYDTNGKRVRLTKELEKLFPLSKQQPEFEEIKKRLVMIQVLKAVMALSDKLITDVREADVASIFGWGFPPYTGGILSYCDQIGTETIYRIAEKMRRQYGNRFNCPPLLRTIGKMQDSFYNRFSPDFM